MYELQAALCEEDYIEGFYRCTEFAICRQKEASLVFLSAQCAALCLSEAGDRCWVSFDSQAREWLAKLAQEACSKIKSCSSHESMCWSMLVLQAACAAALSKHAPSSAVQPALAAAAAAQAQGCFSSTENAEAFMAMHRLKCSGEDLHEVEALWASRPGADAAAAHVAAATSWSGTQAASSSASQATLAVAFAGAGAVMHALGGELHLWVLLFPLVLSAAVLLHQGQRGPFETHNARATREYITGGIKGLVFRSQPTPLSAFPPHLGELEAVQQAAGDLTLPPPPDRDAVLQMVQVDLEGAKVQQMDPTTKEYQAVGQVSAAGTVAPLPPPPAAEGAHVSSNTLGAGDGQAAGNSSDAVDSFSVGGIGAAEVTDPLEAIRLAAGLGRAAPSDRDSLAVQLLPTDAGVGDLPAVLAQHASQHTERGGGGPLLLGGGVTAPGSMPMPLPVDLVDTLSSLQKMLLEGGDEAAAAAIQEKIDFAHSLMGQGSAAACARPGAETEAAGAAESKM